MDNPNSQPSKPIRTKGGRHFEWLNSSPRNGLIPSQSHRILVRTSMASMARAKKGATSKRISAGCETAGSVVVLRGMMFAALKKTHLYNIII